jgi:aminoglycoside 6'-N-acetyltransferase
VGLLEGDGVSMWLATSDDVPALAAGFEGERVRDFWGTWDARRVQAELLDDRDVASYVIAAGGEVVGYVQYSEEPDPDYRHAAIDIAVADHVAGQGIGPRAIGRLVRHLIDDRGHHRITIDPRESNAAAVRAYAKVGFRPVGTMRQYERDWIDPTRWHDGLLMELLASDLA